MNDASHDCADIAAKFLTEDLPPEVRRDIEAHMVSCDSCWAEMTTARAGRAYAEALREPAPQSAREALRSIAASPLPASVAGDEVPLPTAGRRGSVLRLRTGSGGAGRRIAAAVLVAVVAAALTGIVSLLSNRPPEGGPLQAAAAEYHIRPGQTAHNSASERPPTERIGDMVWTETSHKPIGSQQGTVYRYADSGGHQVVLISSAESFPRADNADAVGSGPEWIAEVDGATILCADSGGLSWLVIAASKDEALAAGEAVGLPV